ncbi:MAG: DUF924 domain-containing protein [Kangiellaceae bacterium]|nr:DUF924 domain-containing protein [Kangiellaceae bacterium]
MNPNQIIEFWFEEIEPALWFKKDVQFDQLIRQRFETIHNAAILCELYQWRSSAKGRLAEIIVLDQFSRNLFRDSSNAFGSDPLALSLAQTTVELKLDAQLPIQMRKFLYMPYMHSESLVVHEQAVMLFSAAGLEDNLDFELRHKAIIERFGRYPHRNDILNRVSTVDELEFLKQPGSSF